MVSWNDEVGTGGLCGRLVGWDGGGGTAELGISPDKCSLPPDKRIGSRSICPVTENWAAAAPR